MDDDDMQQALDIRDFEIERRLDVFARARLSPDPQAVARARARVMREARLHFEAARIAAHVAPAVAMANRRPLARRIAMPLLAASLWIGVAVGSVAAAQAGGPLYPTRLWLENVTLPTAIADRTAAELARLDARLGDAMTGASRGDAAAVAAALDAYGQIANETIAASTGNESLEDLVSAALDRHRAVLSAVAESLEAKGNTTAMSAVETAIERAIEHNAAVVAAFAGNGGSHGSNGSGTGSGFGAGAGGSGATTGGSSGGSGAGGPDPSGAPVTGGSGSGAGGNGDNGQTGGGKPDKSPKPAPSDEPTSSQEGHQDGQGAGSDGRP